MGTGTEEGRSGHTIEAERVDVGRELEGSLFLSRLMVQKARALRKVTNDPKVIKKRKHGTT